MGQTGQTFKFGLAAGTGESVIPDYSAKFSGSSSGGYSASYTAPTTTETTTKPKNKTTNEWFKEQGVKIKEDPSVVTKGIETAFNVFGGIFNMVKDIKSSKGDGGSVDVKPVYVQPPTTDNTTIMGMNKQTFYIGAGVLAIIAIGVGVYVVTKNKNTQS